MQATIIGAGIAGLALAKGLRAVGFHVEVFEQAPELKAIGAGIALTANGLRALRSLWSLQSSRRARRGDSSHQRAR
jgi:2-polyprenyl-6-methoxyphenol hydroxylase-like FAD-dependent oxidoreductase